MIYQVQTDTTEINKDTVAKWIQFFKKNILPNRLKMGAYYDGENAIIKQGAVQGRPNYSINVNMAKYIIDVSTAYTFGIPIKYSAENENAKQILDKLQYILKNCSANEIDFQQGGDMATYGVSYQLVLAPAGSGKIEDRISIKYLNPLQTFYVVDNTILEKPVCAVYMYDYIEDNLPKTKIYAYDNTDLYIFVASGGMVNTLESQEPHNMGAIPIIQCLNNDDAFSDIQCITDLLDSLSLVVSNNTDDLQSIANAILAVSGGQLNEEHIKEINQYKVANLPIGASMQWIVKNLNPEATRQQIDYLLNFIFQIAQVPDLTDDAFGGNQSGVAIKYKLWGMNQLWITKTTKYEKALYYRLKILLHLLQYQFDSNVALLDNIAIEFSKNLPSDDSTLIDSITKLKGIISDKTLLGQIPFIDDVEKEIEQLDMEADKEADRFGYNNNEILNNGGQEE